MWHGYTEPFRRQGKLQVAGIIQEQHPDRARLFMQWKQMDWPILVDSLNLLAIDVVPLTLLIYEHGIIRKIRPKEEELDEFLATEYPVPPRKNSTPGKSELRRLEEVDELFLWKGVDHLDRVVDGYRGLLEESADVGPLHFRLGVAYRRRHDSDFRQPGDFEKAVVHWTAALDANPNQSIWRRRIQQYGPRLDKPYPFYDWVPRAREEIRAAGAEPVALIVEPGGAEFAQPAREFEATGGDEVNPDERGRILRDEEGFVQVETVVVPARIEEGKTGRVHLEFRPNRSLDAHWNNESEGLVLWIESRQGWTVERRLLSMRNPPRETSNEVRRLEVEFQVPAWAVGSHTLSSYALYYVCEGRDGTCVYRRQDIPITVKVQ